MRSIEVFRQGMGEGVVTTSFSQYTYLTEGRTDLLREGGGGVCAGILKETYSHLIFSRGGGSRPPVNPCMNLDPIPSTCHCINRYFCLNHNV